MNNDSHKYERYHRQLALPELGAAGQQKLFNAKLLMVGAGGLGCAALQYLAAAGIGNIGIADDDNVSVSNLHRQVLYNMEDIGKPKAEQAVAKLRLLNPDIVLTAINVRLNVSNALAVIAGYDLVIDGTDNFASRYMINDACALLNKPLIYGAVSKFEGQVAVFNVATGQGRAVNYRDLFPHPPSEGEVANCEEAGVLGVLPGIIGAMQANEAIKLITGIGAPLINKLYTFNALNYQAMELELAAGAKTMSFIPADSAAFLNTDYEWLCGIYPAKNEVDIPGFDILRKLANVLVADVREYGELPVVNEFNHIHVPVSRIDTDFPENGSDTIVVYCQSGKRSVQAAKMLALKFGESKKVFSLAGGILQWKKYHQL